MSIDKLKDRGWYLTEAGLKKLTENKNNVLDENGITKLAMNMDFREIAGGALNSLLKQDALQGNVVLQLVKVRNCSAPKSNEESKSAPRLLRIHLTDGQTQCQAVEMENIQALTLNLPPGTKILLKNGPIKCSHALLQLRANNVEVLGGHVVALVEKWDLNRSLAMYAKGARPNHGTSGPPRWIPFGKPIPLANKAADELSFNSMAEAQTKMIADENHSEFDSQRNDAISEAIKTENKKVFGGGTKQLQDANVQKIMDKGYTEEQAKTALRFNKNSVDLALNSLKKREERSQRYNNNNNSDRDESQTKSLPTRGKGGKDKQEKPEGSSKPSTKISLFDFVEDKLPETTSDQNQVKSSQSTNNNNQGGGSQQHQYNNRRNDSNHNSYNSDQKSRSQNRFENNISASFASRNQGPPYGHQQQQHHQSNNYYNNRNERSDNRGNQRNDGGYQNRRQNDYNDSNNRNSGASRSNTYPGPRNDNKRYDNRENSYNSHQDRSNQGSYNTNRYQKDYTGNQQQQQQQQQQSHQQQSYSQKSDYRNDYKSGDQKHHERNDRTANYQSSHEKQASSSSSYQRGGYSNSNRDYRQSSGTENNKNERSQQNNNYGSNNYDYASNSSNKTSHHQNQQGQQNQSGTNNKTTSSHEYARPGAGPKHQNQSSNYPKNSEHHQQRRSPPGQQVNNTNKQNVQSKSSYNKPNQQTQSNINQIVDGTANLKLATSHVTTSVNSSNNSQQTPVTTVHSKVPPQQSHQPGVVTSHHTLPPQTQMNKNFVAIPNGTYNPYQIIGFQNKATNEFAMNVLKTQQLPVTTANTVGVPTQNPPPPVVPVPVVPITSVAAPPMQPGQFVQPPPFGHPPVIPSPQPIANQFLPPGTTVAFPTAVSIGMMPQVKFNVGDYCVAKYWEDERFYPAVITDVTENTHVVRFVDYGNFEEVLKHDCLPLNGAQPTPVFSAARPAPTQILHHGPPMQHPPQPAQPQQPQQQQQQQQMSTQNKPGNKSYREQRGVYVPPQKRM